MAHYPHPESVLARTHPSVPISRHRKTKVWTDTIQTGLRQDLRRWVMEPMQSGERSIMVSREAGLCVDFADIWNSLFVLSTITYDM